MAVCLVREVESSLAGKFSLKSGVLWDVTLCQIYGSWCILPLGSVSQSHFFMDSLTLKVKAL
jgi:hypothetical protein